MSLKKNYVALLMVVDLGGKTGKKLGTGSNKLHQGVRGILQNNTQLKANE